MTRRLLPFWILLIALANCHGASGIAPAPEPNEVSTANPTKKTHQGEAKLKPVLFFLRESLQAIEEVDDYSATLIARGPATTIRPLSRCLGANYFDELLQRSAAEEGTEIPHFYNYIRVRHAPFTVDHYTLGPKAFKGWTAFWYQGPKGHLDQSGFFNIPDYNIRDMTQRILDILEKNKSPDNMKVRWYADTKVKDRLHTCVHLVRPEREQGSRFHHLLLFFDDETKLLTRLQSFDWPVEEGGKPKLAEESTFVNIKLNQGFTDEDLRVDQHFKVHEERQARIRSTSKSTAPAPPSGSSSSAAPEPKNSTCSCRRGLLRRRVR